MDHKFRHTQQVFLKPRIEGNSYLEESEADRMAVRLPSEVATSLDQIAQGVSEAKVKSWWRAANECRLALSVAQAKLDDKDWNDVEQVIWNQCIKGRTFLSFYVNNFLILRGEEKKRKEKLEADTRMYTYS